MEQFSEPVTPVYAIQALVCDKRLRMIQMGIQCFQYVDAKDRQIIYISSPAAVHQVWVGELRYFTMIPTNPDRLGEIVQPNQQSSLN